MKVDGDTSQSSRFSKVTIEISERKSRVILDKVLNLAKAKEHQILTMRTIGHIYLDLKADCEKKGHNFGLVIFASTVIGVAVVIALIIALFGNTTIS